MAGSSVHCNKPSGFLGQFNDCLFFKKDSMSLVKRQKTTQLAFLAFGVEADSPVHCNRVPLVISIAFIVE